MTWIDGRLRLSSARPRTCKLSLHSKGIYLQWQSIWLLKKEELLSLFRTK